MLKWFIKYAVTLIIVIGIINFNHITITDAQELIVGLLCAIWANQEIK